MDDSPQSTIPSQSRREFVANIVLGIGTVFGLGSLAFRFLEYLYPVIPPVKLIEVPAGTLEEIPSDGVRMIRLPQGPVLLKKQQNQVRALSAVCTHLGCIVQWHAAKKQFICPCHHGVYNVDGNVVSGPPPRPLEPLQVKLHDGRIFVLMKSTQGEGQR